MDERAEQQTVMKRLGEQIASVFGWVKKQVRSNPLPFILVVILLLFLTWVTWETSRLDNLGFGEKTYWDWMELLIIPIVLAIGAWWLNKSEKEAEREIAEKNREEDRAIADERRHQATLEAYLDRMTELLLKEGLRESQEDDEVRSIARTRTLAVLRSLDGKRKGHVIQFLYESGLIGPKPAVVWLARADLHGTELERVTLIDADLGGTDLHRANMRGALLCKSCFIEADMYGALLKGADLRSCDFSGANLAGADLREAGLEGDSRGENTSLLDVNLDGANLKGAFVSSEQLRRTKSKKGMIWPDGTKHD
jgi:hypothetical protein